jgi:DNA-binding transcriptional ArsR family regulator
MLKQRPPVDDVFRALSDPTRRRMVEHLGRGPATVSELALPLDITLSAVVQHLALLEACGLAGSEKVGRTRTCHLRPVGLQLAEDWFAGQRAIWDRRLDRLGEALEADEAAEKQATRTEPREKNKKRRTP